MIDIRVILEGASDSQISSAITETFRDVVKHCALRAWRAGGIDAGHFVEAVRRFLEFKLTGNYTPFSRSLTTFNEAALRAYENATGDEAYRIIIPRILYGMFAIRNKRGIGHKTSIVPNEMDAAYLLNATKWVVAELVRLNSTHSAAETECAVSELVRVQVPLVWEEGGVSRVLDTNIRAREQVLVLLALKDNQSTEDLRASVGYKNKSSFMGILRKLHDGRQIELKANACMLTPLGFFEAEKVVANARAT